MIDVSDEGSTNWLTADQPPLIHLKGHTEKPGQAVIEGGGVGDQKNEDDDGRYQR